MNNKLNEKTMLIASDQNWIEGDALEQMKNTAELPGMKQVIGMPDIHPGKGNPVGAVFISEDLIYPYLVGNDVGCGMALFQTDLDSKKIRRDKWAKKLKGLETRYEEDVTEYLHQHGLTPSEFDHSLGTIGGGNHFAELQCFEEVFSQELMDDLNLTKSRLMLLVHSGSRSMGEAILRKHVDQFKADGILADSKEGQTYLQSHDQALRWAKANREMIAERFLSQLGSGNTLIFNTTHNSVLPIENDGNILWYHRKGVSSSQNGPVIVAGSRGTLSYLVKPIGEHKEYGYSIAHGAGRKWKRGETKQRLSKFKTDSLNQTELGSKVICENKDLLYEEAPQAYKNIEIVIQDMVDAGMIQLIATLRPVITYKTRKR